jgi:hypothetical protein
MTAIKGDKPVCLLFISSFSLNQLFFHTNQHQQISAEIIVNNY